MKIIEERYLKKSISQFNKYIKDHRDFLDFFNEASHMMNKPLQDMSFKSDLNFFDEVSFILSVIISIISHPHLVNKGEEIIIRSELAPQLSNDMFQKTIRDSKLWSEEGIDMIPEYVYYYQQTDELIIYENIFIVMLIKKIEQELLKYNDFYISTIQTFESNGNLSLKKDNSDIALKRIQILLKKIKRIKNTYFYKEVSKAQTKIRSVHPTNILLKDRLYNYCFKFYKMLVTYADKASRLYDIRLYYFVQLIKYCKSKGFSLEMELIPLFNYDSEMNIIIPKIDLESEDFNISVYPDDKNIGIILEVINNKVKIKNSKTSKHLLLFNDQSTFEDLKYSTNLKYHTIEALSLWNMAKIDVSTEIVYKNPMTENELISNWLDSKLHKAYGSKDIYSLYCASCRNQYIDENEGIIKCEKCKSEYTFFTSNESKETIWFLKLRR